MRFSDLHTHTSYIHTCTHAHVHACKHTLYTNINFKITAVGDVIERTVRLNEYGHVSLF